MAVATSLVIAGAVATAAGATTQGIAARRAKNEAEDQNEIKNTMQSALDSLVEERPAFNNPYENMTNQFENLDNPYANLTVATEAFKMQAEQADQALANSLDVMMETGQAAGGAAALAQAALQSKRGIAEGAQRLDEMKAQGSIMEQQDAINFHEAKMDRTAKLLDNAAQNEMDAKAARSAAIAGIGQSVVQGVGMIVPGFSSLGGEIPAGAAQIGK